MAGFVAFLFGFALGGLVLSIGAEKFYQVRAIENSCAHYDSKSGNFLWGQP